MMKGVVLVLVLCLAVAHVQALRESISERIEAEMMEKEQERLQTEAEAAAAESMGLQVQERAALMFRALDSDHSNTLTAEDIHREADKLKHHVPGVTPDEFISFLQLADTDGDGALSKEEFLNGMMQSADAATSMTRWGFLKKIGGFIKNGINKVKNAVTSAFKGPQATKGDDGCVLCQYIVERCEVNVKQSGVIPSLTGAASGPQVFLEESAVTEEAPAMSLLEVQAKAEQNPFDLAASSIIGATRMSTRYQRQLERQKYNEIYRVVDITLDDVCEQGMPTGMYKHCKAIYALQSDVVDGLRYQYRPADICFRVGMCGKKSYITKGIHSRYNSKHGHYQKKQ